MSRIDSSAVGRMMLINVGLGASKTRAMFELMDCHRLTTDERLGLEIFFATHFSSGPRIGEDSAARDRSHTGDSARAVGFGITAYINRHSRRAGKQAHTSATPAKPVKQ